MQKFLGKNAKFLRKKRSFSIFLEQTKCEKCEIFNENFDDLPFSLETLIITQNYSPFITDLEILTILFKQQIKQIKQSNMIFIMGLNA